MNSSKNVEKIARIDRPNSISSSTMSAEASASSNPFALLENEDEETFETVFPKRTNATNKSHNGTKRQTKRFQKGKIRFFPPPLTLIFSQNFWDSLVKTDAQELPTTTYEEYLQAQGLKERKADVTKSTVDAPIFLNWERPGSIWTFGRWCG